MEITKRVRSKASKIRAKFPNLLSSKWGRLTVRGWIEVVGILAAIGCIGSILFIKREVVEYLPGHTFSVRDPAFFGSAHAAADPFPVDGNRITLLHNGNGIFPEMLKTIRGAQKTINFEAFILHSGKVGTQFIDALCDRAKEGVEVRIIVDGVGSGLSLKSSDVDKLINAGCKFAYFHPTRALRLDRINRRTHRRILVVDGSIGFTGGAGFADEWDGNGDSPKHWREVHAKIEGPLVAKLQGAFQQHWLQATNEILGGPYQFPSLKPVGDLKAQVVVSTSFSVAALPLVQAISIAAAEKSICIVNPYCTPTDEQVALLDAAVKRGVDVRLILPGVHNDMPMTKTAGRTSYGKLLESGVKIFEYQPTMIHAKTMVVDSMFSVFGTSNLDARSSQINEEIDVTVYDKSFAKEMEKVFDEDIKKARPYLLEDFKKRSVWSRFTEWIVIPFRSQL